MKLAEAAVLFLSIQLSLSQTAPISDVPDLETLQSQARYDPVVLTQGLGGTAAEACTAGDIQYAHGQKIWRPDPCESCLCLDGETFCWWQKCPQGAPELYEESPDDTTLLSTDISEIITDEIDCENRTCDEDISQKPTSNSNLLLNPTNTVTEILTAEAKKNKTDLVTKPTILESSTTNLNTNKEINNIVPFNDDIPVNNISPENISVSTDMPNFESTTHNETPTESSSGEIHKVETQTELSTPTPMCIVLGTQYKVGAILPRDTGNCLQCVCASGPGNEPPRITCSPHNCAPLSGPDMFDASLF